ncbi:EVE domain-containing protein [Candidatus Micrarchaeota archaeon]|nr:EVE domain-containing protein [Candidatus Micrarchaeota archaeon]MBU1681241.1 EVE domain-containing protein [Candidatus Micrarchaeota archaeon]
MNNYWIFVVNDWKDSSGHKHKANEIFDTLKVDKVWGIGERTPNRKNLSSGDKVVFYQAGSNGQRFLGHGTLSSKCKHFSKDSHYSEKTNNIIYEWGNIVTFEDFDAFEQSKPLSDLAENLDFIVKKEMAAAYFQSGVRSITKTDFDMIVSEDLVKISQKGQEEGIEDKGLFVLEKYLQDFIVSNWDNIDFGQKLRIYQDDDGNPGPQYTTDVGYIDILAIDEKNNFVVIELKKGRESDKVVGQLLRYIGWVKKNLATKDQGVQGIIICKDLDEKLEYAVSAVSNISIKRYSMSFKLL